MKTNILDFTIAEIISPHQMENMHHPDFPHSVQNLSIFSHFQKKSLSLQNHPRFYSAEAPALSLTQSQPLPKVF